MGEFSAPCAALSWLQMVGVTGSRELPARSRINIRYRNCGGIDFSSWANSSCRHMSTGRCLTVVLAG